MRHSVTQVIDHFCPPELVNFFKNHSKAKCEQIAKESALIGQRTDWLIQQDIKGDSYHLETEPAEVQRCMAHWETIKKEHPGFTASVKEMQTELVDGELVGHPDFICVEANGWGITDLKCTKNIRLKNWVQTAEYAAMLMRIRGWAFPDFLRVIRLPSEEGKLPEWFEVRDPDMILYCIKLFDHYLEIFRGDFVMREFIRVQLEERVP